MQQPTLPADFNLKTPRGLCTPRAFVNFILEHGEMGSYPSLASQYGVHDWASGYAEPGYTDPDHGVLFGNWNDPDHKWNGKSKPERFAKIAEFAEYAIEWYDEWSTCGDCGKAVRTSPDSHGWSPSYAILNECELVCGDCLNPEDILSELSGDPDRCLSDSLREFVDPTAHGYRKWNEEDYESGFHPGQTDNPREIAKGLRAQGIEDFVFVQTDQGQFDTRFSVYVREDEDHED